MDIAGIPTDRSRSVTTAGQVGSYAGEGLMSRSAAKNSPVVPVTVTQLPVTRCEICQRTVAFRPGEASAALTKHYELRHKEALGTLPAGTQHE